MAVADKQIVQITNCPRLESSRIDLNRDAVKISVLDHRSVGLGYCRTWSSGCMADYGFFCPFIF